MKKQVLLVTDADKDDLYCLNLLMAQRHLGSIEVVGILCEDGFLTYPENLNMVSFWLNTILHIQGEIPLIRGIKPDPYLRQQRQFPSTFITSYVEQMTNVFGYVPCPPNPIPSFVELRDFMETVMKQISDHSLYILTSGPFYSYEYICQQYPWFRNKMAKVFSMMGNLNVPGNVVPSDPNDPTIVPNAEYNAWLSPNAWTLLSNHIPCFWRVVPLDCTNHVPLNPQTIQTIQTAALPYVKHCKDPFLLHSYDRGIQLLYTTLQTINTKLYMWDEVACILFFRFSSGQTYKKRRIWISWTGKLEIDKTFPKIRVYDSIDYSLFLQNLVSCQFQFQSL